MFLADLLAALLVSLGIAAIFVLLLGWRRPGAEEDAWGAALFFLLLLFLPVWAIGVWIPPLGPAWLGVYWLELVALALLLALVVAAVAPPPRRGPVVKVENPRRSAPAMSYGFFFWTLTVVAVVAVVWAEALP